MVLQAAFEAVLKGLAGGVLVVLFALFAEALSPKRFAGVFAAAPSVALASLTVTVLMKDAFDARSSTAGMIDGAVGFLAYSLAAPLLMKRWGSIRGAGAALGAWFAVTAVAFAVTAGTSAGRYAVAATGHRRQESERPPLSFQPHKIAEARPVDWWTRFAFGAGTSLVAGVVSAAAGPLPGGTFLAFPAILLASLTLVRQKDGAARARDCARGSAAGALGLLAFAIVGSVAFVQLPTPLVFLLATLAWAVVALAAYGVTWLLGAGGDEPKEA
jgi:hypothetical protein